MRALAICAALASLPACIYYDPGPQPEQADAIIFYPPDARIDGAPVDAGDITLCTTEIGCPESTGGGRVSVCGRIKDVETGDLIDPGITGEVCRPGNTDGACALDIQPYDALAFAADTSTPPQGYGSKYLDTCGRYQLVDVNRPGLGYLGLGIDDAGATDNYGIGGAAMQIAMNETRDQVEAFAITHATDASWTTTANLSGESFLERGVILMVFRDADGNPVEGVTVTEGPAAEPLNDFYFSDTTPLTRRTVDPALNATGPNGSALKIISDLVDHSGTGGCANWSAGLATTIRGVMLYAPRECQ